MAIVNPSQQECDNMEPGDKLYIKDRGLLYKWYRKNYLDLPKLKIKTDFNPDSNEYTEQYQEDCTIMLKEELQGIQVLDKDIHFKLISPNEKPIGGVREFKEIIVGINNTRLRFKNGLSIMFPTEYIQYAIRKNEYVIKQCDDEREMRKILADSDFKPEDIKEIVKRKKLRHWIPSYCVMCGKSVDLRFYADHVDVINNCKCGNISLNYTKLTYEQLCMWMINQTNLSVLQKIDRDWFKEKKK